MNPYSEQWRNGDGVKEDEEKIMGVGEEGGYSYNYYLTQLILLLLLLSRQVVYKYYECNLILN